MLGLCHCPLSPTQAPSLLGEVNASALSPCNIEAPCLGFYREFSPCKHIDTGTQLPYPDQATSVLLPMPGTHPPHPSFKVHCSNFKLVRSRGRKKNARTKEAVFASWDICLQASFKSKSGPTIFLSANFVPSLLKL